MAVMPKLGHRVGRICVIFSLSPKAIEIMFNPGIEVPKHLVYVQWYTKFPDAPDATT
jgi:hypothetical protein